MGYNTKIDWSDSSWNPVTGCLHGCEYCYARAYSRRYEGHDAEDGCITTEGASMLAELSKPIMITRKNGKRYAAPYPFGFTPTFHRYRLDYPSKWSEPRNIFVGSMCDLFGAWVPDSWIRDVIDACKIAPWHRYLFLTKNPSRYIDAINKGIIPANDDHFYLGTTTTTPDAMYFWQNIPDAQKRIAYTFVSIEPILADFGKGHTNVNSMPGWVIVGAETGFRKGKVIPKRAWIDNLVEWCETWNIPIFMKSSLSELMGDDLKQEYPWPSQKKEALL